MKLGIMQPYFLPYLGYFDLINCADRWIVFDTPQYIRHGWVNRNRILHPSEGWQYIVVPLRKHGLDTPISDVVINDDIAWRAKILGQLAHYRRRAPFYAGTVELVAACFDTRTTSLAELNVHALATVCAHIGIPFQADVFSRMSLSIGAIGGPGDWALEISKALGAAEYLNPPGGREIFDQAAFDAAGIGLTIRDVPPMEYSCRGYRFEPRLSVIDALMWAGPAGVKAYLADLKPRETP